MTSRQILYCTKIIIGVFRSCAASFPAAPAVLPTSAVANANKIPFRALSVMFVINSVTVSQCGIIYCLYCLSERLDFLESWPKAHYQQWLNPTLGLSDLLDLYFSDFFVSRY